MKSAYSQHAQRTGKVLPEGWDTVKLAEAVLPTGVKGMKRVTEEDPDYQPEPIHFLDPTIMGMRQIEDYLMKFETELEELNRLRETGTARDYTKAKMDRKVRLEDKIAVFEVEKENRLAKMGESRRPGDIGEEDPKVKGHQNHLGIVQSPKKGHIQLWDLMGLET